MNANATTELMLLTGVRRWPKPPKPHVMRRGGWWHLIDPPRSWQQLEPITKDPRP